MFNEVVKKIYLKMYILNIFFYKNQREIIHVHIHRICKTEYDACNYKQASR